MSDEEGTVTQGARRASPLRAGLLFAAFAVAVIAVVCGVLWYRHHSGVSTDDAFVRSSISHVSPDVGGRVLEVRAQENGHVAKGDLLVVLDDEPYQLGATAAEAALQAATADAERAAAASGASDAQVALAEARLTEARRERKLQTDLVAAGSSVQSALERARDAVHVAEAALSAAQRQAESATAATAAARAHVESARAAVALARRDVGHTRVTSPVDGIATRVETVPGDWLRPGQSLFAIVPDEVYVVANFKETQLDEIHVGDPVDVRVDAYPELTLHGSVQSIGAGTTAAFSLLPADNASGNFVKVVQRVPVRIALDEVDRPLAVGLSVRVRVRPGGRG